MPQLQPNAELVETVVAEVIRRLRAMGAIVEPAAAEAANGTVRKTELVVEEKLVTLATVVGRLAGMSRVVVRSNAVVTPAVRDELRDRGIELQKGLS